MRKKLIILMALVFLVLLVVLSLIKGRKDENVLPEIRWTAASIKPLEETISASGEFRARTREILSARTEGRVESIPVKEGDPVEAGQTLLVLESEDYRQRVLSAEASLEKIRRSISETLLSHRLEYVSQEMSLRQSREKLAKQEELFKLEAITEEELKLSRDKAESEAQSLNALGKKLNLICGMPLDTPPLLSDGKDGEIIENSPDVRQQRLALEQARRDLDRCTVRAGSRGRVVKISTEKGMPVEVGTKLIIMQGAGPMEAVVTVDEVDIGKLRPGDAALVKSDSLIGEEIGGRITSISPILELFGNTRAGEVAIELDETDLPLRGGASCVAEITTLARSEALTVPAEAIVTERGKILLFRLDEKENKTVLTAVEPVTGISTIDDLEILEGLENGDRIALPGGDLILRDGLYVVPTEESSGETADD